jgi:hypothetical protein
MALVEEVSRPGLVHDTGPYQTPRYLTRLDGGWAQSTSRPFVWGHHLRVRSANEDRPVFCVSGSDQRGKPSRLGKVDDVTCASQPVVPLRRRRE